MYGVVFPVWFQRNCGPQLLRLWLVFCGTYFNEHFMLRSIHYAVALPSETYSFLFPTDFNVIKALENIGIDIITGKFHISINGTDMTTNIIISKWLAPEMNFS